MQKPLYKRGVLLVRYLMVVVVVLGAATFASPAAAEHPLMWEDTLSGTFVDEYMCPLFPVTVKWTATHTLTAFVDDSGEWQMGHHHAVEVDTFSANGKTLVSMPYHFNITNFFGSDLSSWHGSAEGIFWKVPLPDGGMFIAAGRASWRVEDGEVVDQPFRGNPGDWAKLCAALAP